MASVDNWKSSLTASDELFHHMCRPCKLTGGNIKAARQYCCNCSEYLCDQCVDYHKTLPLLKTHKIISADTVSVGCTGRRLTLLCGCNKSQEVVFYCEEHDDVICSPCKSFKHHKCQTHSIQHKSSGYATAKLESLIEKTKSLKEQYDQLKKKCSENQKELKMSKDTCKKEIKAFRKELENFLDILEQNMLAELEQLETKQQMYVDQHISVLTMALQMLDADCLMLSNAKTDGRKQTMFAADVQISKGLQDYECRLTDLEKNITKHIISFEKNRTLNDLQEEITTIGSLKIPEKIDMQGPKTVLLGQKVGPRRELHVRLFEDGMDPYITGCVVMPNDCIVICDNSNSKLKVLDSNFEIIYSYEMESPTDVAVIDNNHVIVSTAENKLQRVRVFPSVEATDFEQLDQLCWGVDVSGDKIYISCHDDPGDGNLRVLDKYGNLERLVDVSDEEYFELSGPFYVSVNRTRDKIFVTDCNNHTITCMTVDGDIIYQYRDKGLRNPCGLYCDDNDNILVCCQNSNRVQVISSDGKLNDTILSYEDGVQSPTSIAYRQSDNILIVGCGDLDHLLVYNLIN